jgi:hypothetical protein
MGWQGDPCVYERDVENVNDYRQMTDLAESDPDKILLGMKVIRSSCRRVVGLL